MTHQHTLQSPLGPITLEADGEHLVAVHISASPPDSGSPHHSPSDSTSESTSDSTTHPVLARAAKQLGEYFAGTRTEFDLPLEPRGTSFQQAIWAQLQHIPYGQVSSYQAVGLGAGVGKAARAVGGAVGANPLPILIPCHRVLSATNSITGYSGGAGIPTKKMLLDLEGISYR